MSRKGRRREKEKRLDKGKKSERAQKERGRLIEKKESLARNEGRLK